MKDFACAFLCLFSSGLLNAQPRELVKQWETEKIFRVPESVLFSGEHNCLFVSCIDGKPTDKDGNGYISKVSRQGKITQEKFVDGLNAPKGMGIFNNMLYVTDIDELVSVDIKTRSIVLRTPVDNAQFLNDVTIDATGVVYFSDMGTGKIHRLINGKLDLFAENIEGVNGLVADNDDLYALAKGVLWHFSRDGEKTIVAEGMEPSSDGLVKTENGFIASSWNGVVYSVSPKGKVLQLLDTRQQKLNTADIGADRENRIIYIPTFFGNTIAAYNYIK